MIIFGILLAVASYFAWSYFHEKAHLIGVDKTVGLVKYEMKLYPHKGEYGFRWASVRYWTKREPTDKEQAIISLAPRIPDLVAVGAFVFTGLLLSSFGWTWLTH